METTNLLRYELTTKAAGDLSAYRIMQARYPGRDHLGRIRVGDWILYNSVTRQVTRADHSMLTVPVYASTPAPIVPAAPTSESIVRRLAVNRAPNMVNCMDCGEYRPGRTVHGESFCYRCDGGSQMTVRGEIYGGDA
mgnify:CR=1 FL=1